METVQQLDETLVTAKQGTIRSAAPGWKSRYSFAAQARAFENARFFWMVLLITGQSCLGSIACFYVQHMGGEFLPLALCAMVTMASNAMFIGLASGRICLGALYLSVAVNLSFILSALL